MGHNDTEKVRTLTKSQEGLSAQYAFPVQREDEHVLLDIYDSRQATCDLVLAGKSTEREFALTAAAPIHFVKRYSAECFPGGFDVAHELQIADTIWKQTGRTAIPLGGKGCESRFEYLPGLTLAKVRPFTNAWAAMQGHISAEAQENLHEYWRLLASSHDALNEMHGLGIIHGDAHINNFMVHNGISYAIDFGKSDHIKPGTARFEAARRYDLTQVATEAAITETLIGSPQKGKLKDLITEMSPMNAPASEIAMLVKEKWAALEGKGAGGMRRKPLHQFHK